MAGGSGHEGTQMTFPIDPVGMPGLIAIALGFLMFLLGVVAARRRKAGIGPKTIARKTSASWAWILVQGIGVGIAGFGPVAVLLDPASPKAIIEAVVILALSGSATALFVASSRAMGANWSLMARTRDDHRLVQNGPFAYVRNPIYVAIFLLMLALAIAYGHVLNLLLAIPVYALGTWMRVRTEEALLRETFGPAYDSYAARVKRFVPGLF